MSTTPVQAGSRAPHLELIPLSALERHGFEPLVEGLLFRDSRAAVYGSAGTGKGILALDLAMCVATGRPWHGCGVSRGKVLYIDGSAGGSLADRVKAWELANHRGSDEISFLLPPNAIAAEQVDELVDLATELSPSLIVLNVTLRTVPGADENAALTISRRLRDATRACVLLVWHATLAEHWESSHVLAAVDTTIEVERQGPAVTVSNRKQRNAREHTDIVLRLADYGDSVALLGGASGT
jgi:hypothetical protein